MIKKLKTFYKLLSVTLLKCHHPSVMQVSTPMDATILSPPCLEGMKVLDRDRFLKLVDVPAVNILHKNYTNEIRAILKPYLLKIPNFKHFQNGHLLLDPCKFNEWKNLSAQEQNALLKFQVSQECFTKKSVKLTFENWNADELIRAVLPKDVEIARSYSLVGHILHLNLKEHLLEYKSVIGNILMEKTPNCRTVVNKLKKIDNTYRNFQMELICGDEDFITKVKENRCEFEFDFAKVYWNPRLSTEHQRIANLVTHQDIFIDVFSGVGPFAIPCARKGARVYANDLNPDCFLWIQKNAERNKCKGIEFFNKDGGDFIRNDAKNIILDLTKNSNFNGKIYVAMNLPALALNFISNFKNLFLPNELSLEKFSIVRPTVHVYFFVFGTEPEKEAITVFEQETGLKVSELVYSVHFVRNVSPKKDMFRVSFELSYSYVVSSEGNEELPAKVPRLQ